MSHLPSTQDVQIHSWDEKTRKVLDATPDVKDEQLLWHETLGAEYPHDLQQAVDLFNKRTTLARMTLDVDVASASASLECHAISLSRHACVDIDSFSDGFIRCDNCAVVLECWMSCRTRWGCACAYVCSHACGDIADHRTNSCKCESMGECMDVVMKWSRAKPTAKLNTELLNECGCRDDRKEEPYTP
jgi:hypothetical protein